MKRLATGAARSLAPTAAGSPGLCLSAPPKVDGMQSWPSAPVPALPGRGPELRLYDTADRQVRPVAPGPKATMYVCGITPYDATHLGHAATYLAFDLIHRLCLDLGHDVHYVQNVTDVDDPLFERADRDGVDWRDLAEQEVALFRADMEALRVLPPHEYVGATEAGPAKVEGIGKTPAPGAAHVGGPGTRHPPDVCPPAGGPPPVG